MIEVIKRLYVGNDLDFEKAHERGFAICSCCKEGPHGHRSILKYKSLAAPKDKDYHFVRRGKHLALNLIDSDNPAFVPDEVIDAALKFIDEHRDGNVLLNCNSGHSRGPSTMLMYLRSHGEMPYSFVQSEKVFRALYPPYEPAQGIRQYARSRWAALAPKEGNE